MSAMFIAILTLLLHPGIVSGSRDGDESDKILEVAAQSHFVNQRPQGQPSLNEIHEHEATSQGSSEEASFITDDMREKIKAFASAAMQSIAQSKDSKMSIEDRAKSLNSAMDQAKDAIRSITSTIDVEKLSQDKPELAKHIADLQQSSLIQSHEEVDEKLQKLDQSSFVQTQQEVAAELQGQQEVATESQNVEPSSLAQTEQENAAVAPPLPDVPVPPEIQAQARAFSVAAREALTESHNPNLSAEEKHKKIQAALKMYGESMSSVASKLKDPESRRKALEKLEKFKKLFSDEPHSSLIEEREAKEAPIPEVVRVGGDDEEGHQEVEKGSE